MELLLDVLLIHVNSQIKLYFKTNGNSFCFCLFLRLRITKSRHSSKKKKNAFELSMSHTWPSLLLCAIMYIVDGVARCLMLHFTLKLCNVGEKETDLRRSTSVLMSRKRNRCLFFYFYLNKHNKKSCFAFVECWEWIWCVPTVQRLISCKRECGSAFWLRVSTKTLPFDTMRDVSLQNVCMHTYILINVPFSMTCKWCVSLKAVVANLSPGRRMSRCRWTFFESFTGQPQHYDH